MSDFLLTTDTNIQKIDDELSTTLATSTSAISSYTFAHDINAIPDVRVWTYTTDLFTGWKMLSDAQLYDGTASAGEIVRGTVKADTGTITIMLRPTSPSINVPVIIRIYPND